MLFAHGFGCDQNMWRYVAPAFEDEYRVVLFDHVGAGRSDLAAYDRRKYSSLNGYAADILELCRELELHDLIFVGHSVSAMMGILAATVEPDRFQRLVLVGPSPRYLNDDGYVGGFAREDIDGLLDSLGEELTNSFCRTDPAIAKHFARVTFLSDNRSDLGRVDIPTLVLQTREDVIAPIEVGEYVERALPQGQLVVLDATGHCPNLSAPEQTIAAIKAFLSLA
jgi:sigma-B regulation protein RsbQ